MLSTSAESEETLISCRTFWGDAIEGYHQEKVFCNIYSKGYHELPLTNIFISVIKPGGNVFDIGAHIGYYSLLASNIVGEKGRIVAFEPTPVTRQILAQNVSSKLNITVDSRAVYNSTSEGLLLNDLGVANSSYNSIYSPRLKNACLTQLLTDKISVDTISIDEYIQKTMIIPSFVKVDAESAEYDVLLGMQSTLENIRPFVSLELGDLGVIDVPTSRYIVDYMKDKEYVPIESDGYKMNYHVPKVGYEYCNILFAPAEKCSELCVIH